MADSFSAQQTVCQRVLTRDDGSGRRDVVIRLLEPEFASQDFLEYRCAFQIDGLDLPVRDCGYGIDSLQALVAANTRATYALWPFRTQLCWLDGPYDWSIAHCVQIGDGGRRRQLRAILQEEDHANAQRLRDMELIRRAEKVRVRNLGDSAFELDDAAVAATSDDSDTTGPEELEVLAEAARQQPICTRRLTCSFTTDVRISIWRPTPVASRGDDHLCVFQVLGLGDGRLNTNLGSDAMQALFIAMRGVDSILNPWRDDLRWFDLTYEDPALFPNVLDAGRQRRIHAIIDEEIFAIEERRRQRQEFDQRRKAHDANANS
jgi:hypothetical protein